MLRCADGVWLLPSLVPHLINCYLLETEIGDVLIDAGTRWGTARLLRVLAGRNLALVGLTHVHPDHQGAAAAVCRRFGVPLACHTADADIMEGTSPVRPRTWIVRLGQKLLAGPPHPVARCLHDGDQLAEWRIVHTPGHTTGHVIYFRERDRVAIAGDLVRSRFGPWPGVIEPPHFFSADPAQNRRSLRLLLALRPSLVCLGHGPPLGDLTPLERLAERFGV
ncbi:MAG: MBL fold metallo-hydrolase [Gemmataceae bacterium]